MWVISKRKVRQIMKRNGINTQVQLARKMNITKNELSFILSSRYDPLKSNARLLCKTLQVSIEEIIEEAVDMRQLSLLELPDNVDDEFVEVRNIKPNRNYTSVELFAGAGGLALGLEKAGFETLGLVEFDKYACQTLRKNRPNWNVIEEDVVAVAEKGIRNYIKPSCEIDLLSGGYPCQAFSYAGNKLGLDDIRGTMFYYYARILDE
jgi:DNA (cytosine-5)-methyltransferase 1